MKFAVKIINAILVIILTVALLGIAVIKIATSTILTEAYLFQMLKTNNYYNKIYEEVKSNLSTYIGPSGLDENVLDNICSVDDIQKDTETILGNIYEGTEKKVDTEAIKQRIKNNINNELKDEVTALTKSAQENIDKFAETVSEEYINTISHTEYEKTINEAYKKITKIIDIAQKALFIAVGVGFILLVILNIKTIYNIATSMGIAFFSSGAFLAISYFIINSKVKVEQIKILNNSISTVLQSILKDILTTVLTIGLTLTAIGIVAIIVGCIIKVINSEKRQKKERKWKN